MRHIVVRKKNICAICNFFKVHMSYSHSAAGLCIICTSQHAKSICPSLSFFSSSFFGGVAGVLADVAGLPGGRISIKTNYLGVEFLLKLTAWGWNFYKFL